MLQPSVNPCLWREIHDPSLPVIADSSALFRGRKQEDTKFLRFFFPPPLTVLISCTFLIQCVHLSSISSECCCLSHLPFLPQCVCAKFSQTLCFTACVSYTLKDLTSSCFVYVNLSSCPSPTSDERYVLINHKCLTEESQTNLTNGSWNIEASKEILNTVKLPEYFSNISHLS